MDLSQLTVPNEGAINWDQVVNVLGMVNRLQAQKEQDRANAVRWEGQQDYSTLVASGVPHEEALRRTAHKLFFNEPAGFAQVLRATAENQTINPRMVNVEGHKLLQTGPRSYQLLPEDQMATEVTYGGRKFLKHGNSYTPLETMGKPTVTRKVYDANGKLIESRQITAAEADAMPPVLSGEMSSDAATFANEKAQVEAGNTGFFSKDHVTPMLQSSNRLVQAGINPTTLQRMGGIVPPANSPAMNLSSIPAGSPLVPPTGANTLSSAVAPVNPAEAVAPTTLPPMQAPIRSVAASAKYASPKDIKAAFKAGDLTLEEAQKLLKEQFPDYQ